MFNNWLTKFLKLKRVCWGTLLGQAAPLGYACLEDLCGPLQPRDSSFWSDSHLAPVTLSLPLSLQLGAELASCSAIFRVPQWLSLSLCWVPQRCILGVGDN